MQGDAPRWLYALGACLALCVVPLLAWWRLAPEPLRAPDSASAPTAPFEVLSLEPETARKGARIVFGRVTSGAESRRTPATESRGTPAPEPLEGAEVSIEGAVPRQTTADGSYRLLAVPLDAVTVVVRFKGFGERRIAIASGKAGSEERLDVTLEPAALVAGVVVDPSGEPVTDAAVSCADRPTAALSTTTDASGRFELGSDAAGCRGQARHDGFGDAVEVVLRAAPDNRLVLEKAASIAGIVVDDRGEPITSYVMLLESARALPGRPPPPRRGHRERVENADGQFSIEGLGPGEYVLSASANGLPAVRSRPVRVESGEQARGVRIVLVPGGTLEGVVRSRHDGRPIAGAVIALDAVGAGPGARASSDEAGGYRLEGVPSEPFSIRVEASGYRTRILSTLSAGSGATLKKDVELTTSPEGDAETEYTGIGASLMSSNGAIVVGQVFSDSPAERAGLRKNDRIVMVDGADAGGWSVTQAVQRLRGPVGSRVSVRVERDGGGAHELTIERASFVR